jgi:hypothetical protein
MCNKSELKALDSSVAFAPEVSFWNFLYYVNYVMSMVVAEKGETLILRNC